MDEWTRWDSFWLNVKVILISPLEVLELYFKNRDKGRGRKESLDRALKGY